MGLARSSESSRVQASNSDPIAPTHEEEDSRHTDHAGDNQFDQAHPIILLQTTLARLGKELEIRT